MGRKTVVYYTDMKGHSPVLAFLSSLAPHEQEKALAYLSYLREEGEMLRRPIAKYLGDRLYELRPKHIRVLYTFLGTSRVVVLHAFRKTTGPVPLHEKQCALSRRADFTSRHEQHLIDIKMVRR